MMTNTINIISFNLEKVWSEAASTLDCSLNQTAAANTTLAIALAATTDLTTNDANGLNVE